MTRRTALGAIAGTVALTACAADDGIGGTAPTSDRAGPTSAIERFTYGDDPSQFAELSVPSSGARRPGTIVIVHGGFWRSEYGLELGRPLAADLVARGWVAWNLEYRRVGNGGGWPATFDDIAAGIDLLSTVEPSLDLETVVAVGHSAGGQLAAWAASRPGLPAEAPGAAPAVTVSGVISQAGVLDLRGGVEAGLGSGAIADLLGGAPDDVPERYDLSSPIDRLPLGVPVRCVHGRGDDVVPLDQSTRYVDAAMAAGDDTELIEVEGDHLTVIDVASPQWARTIELVEFLTSS